MSDLKNRIIILNSYTPICYLNKKLNRKERSLNEPPFKDFSIQREPDFELEFPTVTSICRGKVSVVNRNFKSLKENRKVDVGDILIYITKKGYYGGEKKHWRITSILKVCKKFENHYTAYEWYSQSQLSKPNNCIGNPFWMFNGNYEKRAKEYPQFLVCTKIFQDLHDPPKIFEEDYKKLFGTEQSKEKLLSTRIPREISLRRFEITLNFVEKATLS